MLGAAFLALTGGEAMYADLGHFGARPIRLSWFGLVLARPLRSLLRPGRAADRRAGRDREPVLPSRAGLGALSARRPGDDRHRDRLAGHHLRGVLAHPASDPARLLPADARGAHGGGRARADLRPGGELASGGRHPRRGARLRLLGRAGRRLRHRRLGADGDHHAARRAHRREVGLQPSPGDRGQRLLPRHRSRVLRRQQREAARGWLVSAAARRHRSLS